MMIKASNLLAAAVVLVLLSTSVAAQTDSENPPAQAQCTRIVRFANNSSPEADKREDRFQKARRDLSERLAERRGMRDERILAHREKFDANRQRHYDRLQERATTLEQSEAVNEFRQALDDAIAKRRSAFDQAREEFTDNLDQLIKDRRDAQDQARAAFQTAAQAAADQARADCEAGSDPETVRDQLKTGLQDSRQQLKIDRQATGDIDSRIKELAARRQAAFKAAQEEFRAAVTSAREELKDVLGVRA